jgi:Zn-finger nucleic acid-binding protein
MEEISYGGDLKIDRCTHCNGLWFDKGEEQLLKQKWMGDALDIGKPSKGKKWDAVDEVACPRCGQNMKRAPDPDQPHIWYEICEDHGMFMDAGEFTDFKHETLSDWFRSLIKGSRC